MRYLLFKVIPFVLFSTYLIDNSLMAQDHDHLHDLHDPNEHAANEIGVGNIISYLTGEQQFAYSLHFHYLRSIKNSRFGFGFGYEQIFDEHKHRTLGIIGSFRPISHLNLAISPGILFPNKENPGIRFAFHSEVGYEFELGPVHLGPMLEFATTFEEVHLGAGLHLAYTF